MHRLFSLLSRAGLNLFVLLMVAMVGLAWLFPEPGSRNGPLHLVQIGNVGVTLIFFFYGLKLEPAKFLAGLGHWKMHATYSNYDISYISTADYLYCAQFFTRRSLTCCGSVRFTWLHSLQRFHLLL